MSNRKRQSDRRASGLLGDLESIRSLLEEEEDQDAAGERSEATGESGDDEDVPLLEDVVHGGVSVNETFLGGEGDFADTAEASGLNDEIFKALLSDEWRESARELLDEARAAIEQHQTDWTPEHTDELNEALKVRIDETLQHWLRSVVRDRIDDLRVELLDAVRDEIRSTIAAQLDRSSDEGPDGE